MTDDPGPLPLAELEGYCSQLSETCVGGVDGMDPAQLADVLAYALGRAARSIGWALRGEGPIEP